MSDIMSAIDVMSAVLASDFSMSAGATLLTSRAAAQVAVITRNAGIVGHSFSG
jgi:hypothetical protein